jgi:hypothetical protein
MKKLISPIITILSICLSLSGCKLDAPDLPAGVTLGSSNLDTYQPVTEGSYWKYKLDFPASIFEISMTGKTQTINGNVYHIANGTYSTGTTAQGFYGINNHKYAIMQNMGTAGDIYFTYLVDNAEVGYTWTDNLTTSGTVNDVPGRVVGKITEKGITKTVSGKVYKNVIHTTVQLQYAFFPPEFETVGTYDFYVAKGIGTIETDSNVMGITAAEVLTDYKIK